MNPLLQSFESQSIIWILISVGVGGLLAKCSEFLFVHIAGPRYKRKKEARALLKKYSCPILKAADSLDRRVQGMIDYIDKNEFNDPEDDYYRLSTLYVFGRYFGWCHILESQTFLEFELSDIEEKRFNKCFYRVFKGINSFYYFDDLVEDEMSSIKAATVPHFAHTAIGELMIEKSDGYAEPTVIEFTKFTQKYENSPDFKKWFSYLETMLAGVKKSEENAHWNRLIVFAINLRLFISYLDPKNRLTAPRKIHYLEHLHPKIRERIYRELEEAGFSHLIK